MGVFNHFGHHKKPQQQLFICSKKKKVTQHAPEVLAMDADNNLFKIIHVLCQRGPSADRAKKTRKSAFDEFSCARKQK